MGQPESIVTNNQVTVDGFDEIFVESDSVTELSRESITTPPKGLTFKEACEHFSLKATALRVRIKSGEVAAEKIEGVNGPEWRIYPTPPLRIPTGTAAQPSQSSKLLEIVQDLQHKLDQANQQLQAAGFRNGYLEAQVESHKEQIKLLPDLQTQALEASQLKERLAATEANLSRIKTNWWYQIWTRLTKDKSGINGY
jgi:hypothetical protein